MADSFWSGLRLELRMALIAGGIIIVLLAALVWLAWQRMLQDDAPVLATGATVSKIEKPIVSGRWLLPESYQLVTVLPVQTVPGPVAEVLAPTAGTFTGSPVGADAMVTAGDVVATMRATPLPATNPVQEQFRPTAATYDAPAPILSAVTSSIPRKIASVAEIPLMTPATGRVLPLPWSPGTLLSQGQAVVRVLTLDPLGAQGLVSESEAAKMYVGMPADVYLETGTAISATISQRGPASADPQGRYQIEATLASRDTLADTSRRQDLQPGLNGRMVVPTETISAFRVPHGWLVPATGGRVAVMTVVTSTVVPLPVTLLADSVDGVWLTGLPESGVMVISGWTAPLAAGQEVTVRTPQPAEIRR